MTDQGLRRIEERLQYVNVAPRSEMAADIRVLLAEVKRLRHALKKALERINETDA